LTGRLESLPYRKRGLPLPRHLLTMVITFSLTTLGLAAAEPASPPDYSAVDALFNGRCLDCHAAKDPEADLVLESFESLMKGGKSGPVIVPGKSSESLLI